MRRIAGVGVSAVAVLAWVAACTTDPTDPGTGLDGGASSSSSASGSGGASSTSSSSGASGTSGDAADAADDGAANDASDDAANEAGDDAGDAGVDASDGGPPPPPPPPPPPQVCGSPCGANEKTCNGSCVPLDDPHYGCASESCYPCDDGRNNVGRAACVAGACKVLSCAPNRADCDGKFENGCEAVLTSTASCGACGNVCGPNKLCALGACVDACPPNLVKCGSSCQDLNSPESCGACGASCPGANGTASCVAGKCQIACDPGAGSCGGTYGCRVVDHDVVGGQCGTTCTACNSIGERTKTVCEASACVNQCQAGFTLCPGACADLQLDNANCGACGTTCVAGEVCQQGACVASMGPRIVTGLTTPQDIVLDAANVYWTDAGTGEVWQVDKTTLAKTLLASGQGSPFGIAVDATHVYWANTTTGTIVRTPIGTNAPATLYATGGPERVVVDATNVYWTTSAGAFFGGPSSGAGPAAQLAAGFKSRSLAQHGVSLWANNDYDIVAIPKKGGALVYTAHAATASYKGFGLSPSGQVHTIMHQSQTYYLDIAAKLSLPNGYAFSADMASDDCSVYWTFGSGIYATKLWRTSGTTTNVIVPSVANKGATGTGVKRIALDATHLYWLDTTTISRVPR